MTTTTRRAALGALASASALTLPAVAIAAAAPPDADAEILGLRAEFVRLNDVYRPLNDAAWEEAVALEADPRSEVPLLVPSSPSIESAAADQKNDDDKDEKSCHIHDCASFGQTFGNLTAPTCGRIWCSLARGLRGLFLQSVPQGVLDASDRVLNFAGSLFVPTLDLKLGVTGGLAYSFFHSAFGLFDGSFDAIFVHGLYPLFLRRPAGRSLVGRMRTPKPGIYGCKGGLDRIGIYSGTRSPRKMVFRRSSRRHRSAGCAVGLEVVNAVDCGCAHRLARHRTRRRDQ
jgi:hypothetical protein